MAERLKQRREFFSLDATNAKRTPEGFLVVPMNATRTGVLTYFVDGKPWKELRPPEEVFKPESMDSLALKPITDGHPTVQDDPDRLVHTRNAKRLQIGMTGENVKAVDGKFLRATAVITDEDAIKKVLAGKAQVSCGYTKDLDESPGYWDGKEINQEGRGEWFDAIQRNIGYNHVATVDRGRCGSEVRLNLDGDHNLIEEDEDMTVKLTVDGKEIEVSADAAEIIKALQKQAQDEATKRKAAEAKITQDAEGKLKTALDEIEALKVENSKLKGSLDAKDAQVKELQDPVKFNARVQERSHLLTTAKVLMGIDSDEKDKKAGLDAMTDLDVKKAALKHISPDLNLDGKDESYIGARFDAAAEATAPKGEKTPAGANGGVGSVLHQTREGRKTMDDAGTAQAVSMLATSLAWKFTLDEQREGKHIAAAKEALGVE